VYGQRLDDDGFNMPRIYGQPSCALYLNFKNRVNNCRSDAIEC
jgi:hypothetical protein